MQTALVALVVVGTSCGLLRGSVEATWVLHPDAEPGETDTSVQIWVLDPHCEDKLSPDKVDIDINETDLSVIVTTRVPDTSHVACKFRANAVPVEVVFDSPLGDRNLLVGSESGAVAPEFDLRGGMPLPMDG